VCVCVCVACVGVVYVCAGVGVCVCVRCVWVWCMWVWVCVCVCVCDVILLLQDARKHFRVTRLVVTDLPLLKTARMLFSKCILCNNKEICKLVEILLRRN